MASQEFQSKLISYQTKLFNFALSLTSDRNNAYDLLQDTTLKALDCEEMYRQNTNFKGWIFTIMHNIFVNNYRRTSYATTTTENSDDIYNMEITHDSDNTPEGSYRVMEITQAINEFSDDFRIPFSLFVSGYKYTEIAQKLQLPVGTVKSRIFTARKRLQEHFACYR
ncbi:MAG: RNA polymerase sigma factor [Muribaculaceae bacterium]|nr:RNA polymerase sigma factor [Muribaculaceae bacterium]